MGLLDKLVDKIIDSAKKKKADAVVTKLAKGNPEFAKTLEKHRRSYEEVKAEVERLSKEKVIKLN